MRALDSAHTTRYVKPVGETVGARPGAREASKRETREALLRAGLAEFGERGLAEPSLDAICARAGFTRGAFYVHFRDRDEFISVVMERVLGAFLDAIIATGDEERDLEQTVARFAGILAAGGEGIPGLQFHRVLEACARSVAIRARFAGLLEEAMRRVAAAAAEGQGSGSVRDDVAPEALSSVLVALALGAVSAQEVGVRFDPVAARDALLALLGRP
jgi:TetR/AcrR family transcriptional repressor of nem operon